MVALRRTLTLVVSIAVVLALASTGLAQDAASDQAKSLLVKGLSQVQAMDFKTAKETFLTVDRAKLSQDEQKSLDENLTKVDALIRQQAQDMEAFNNADKALRGNDLVKAREGFSKAAASTVLPEALRRDARSQLALVDERMKLAEKAAAPSTPAVATTPAAAGTPAPAVKVEKTTVATPAPAPVATTAPAPLPPPPAPAILTQVQRSNLIAKQEADLEFQKAMILSTERLTGANSLAEFDASIDAARVAKNVLETNKMYFTGEEYRSRLARVNDQIDFVLTQRQAWEGNQAKVRQTEINNAESVRAAKARADRQMKIDQLKRQAETFIRQNDYGKALQITEQMLTIEPTNDWAADRQGMLRQLYLLREERRTGEQRNYEEQKNAIEMREAEIPWHDIMKYPKDWRELTASRERYSVTAANESESDRAALQKLRQKLPKLDFNDIDFENVVQFLRDVGNTNIDVNWQALMAAGIEKTSKVNVHLMDVTFEKALRVVLSNVGGVTALSFVVDEGVITISTKEDLSQKTISRVYDISDMIVRVPNFAGPVLDFTQSYGNTGSSGSSGGGGLFGNTSSSTDNATGEENIPTKQEMIEKIVATFKQTVDPDSWRPEGTIGTINELNGQLIVTQTADNHAALSNVISQLRESHALQISIEARFITVNSGFLESIGLDLDFYFNLGSRLGGNVIRDPATGAVIGPRDPFTNAIVPNTSSPSGWGNGFPGNDNFTPIGVNQGSRSFANMLNQGTGIGAAVGAPSMSVGGTFLDDFQVNFLLEATQASDNTRTLIAPRLTIYNGQRAYVTVGTQQAYIAEFEPVVSDNVVALRPIVNWIPTGSVLDVEGTVSADRRYVTLTIRPQVSTLNRIDTVGMEQIQNSPVFGDYQSGVVQLPNVTVQKLETTVNIPDGGTLLLGGQKLVTQVEREQGVPLLSKIPIINRAFTNRGMTRDEQTLLILVKPKILIQRVLEEQSFPPE